MLPRSWSRGKKVKIENDEQRWIFFIREAPKFLLPVWQTWTWWECSNSNSAWSRGKGPPVRGMAERWARKKVYAWVDWNELAAAILTSSSAKLIKGGIREGEGPEISHVTAVYQRVGGAHLQQEGQPKIPRELDVSWADKDLTHDWPTNPEVRAKSQYFRKRPKPCHKLRNTGNLRCRFVRPDCGPSAECSGDKRGIKPRRRWWRDGLGQRAKWA